jgi:hypothetical protein
LGPGECYDPITGSPRPIVQAGVGELIINEWMPNPALVQDTVGEWFELRALVDVDLNDLQAGQPALGGPIVSTTDCVPLLSGELALFARSADTAMNGMLPTPDGVFVFSLPNTTGTIQIGYGGTVIDQKSWTSASAGTSIMIDVAGTQCNATGGPLYNGTDIGTPAAQNAPSTCP